MAQLELYPGKEAAAAVIMALLSMGGDGHQALWLNITSEEAAVLLVAHIVPLRVLSPSIQSPVTDLILLATGFLHSTMPAGMAQAARIWASTLTAGAAWEEA